MIKKLTLYSVLTLFFLINTYICIAQTINLKEYQNKYPDDSKICLNLKKNIVINIVGDSLNISMRNIEESLLLDKNSILNANQSVTFSDNFKITNLTAETRLPGIFGYKTFKVQSFDTSDYREPGVFIDDVKSINFSYPKLEAGAVTYLDYTYNITEPRNTGVFYFNSFIPVLMAELTVVCPVDVHIGYKLFNCDSLHIEFTKKQSGNNIEYKWKAKNIQKLNVEDNSPPYPWFASHMFVYITDYYIHNKKIKILENESDLHNWYHSLISSLNTNEYSPSLKSLVDSLTHNYTDQLAKVKSIFYWVQDHIKYIAVEAGKGGYVPRNADDVFAKRYGDCKDMSSLINKMLAIAGIESHITWVGTRNIPYNYHELPVPIADDHMIVTYKYNNNYYFLDGTTGPHPIDYPPSNIQGKEAMVDLGPDSFMIVKIPEVEKDLNLKTDTIRIKLEGSKITGKGITTFRGYERVDLYDNLSYKDQVEENRFMKNFFEKGNNKFLMDNYKIKYLENRDSDLIISYNFNISDYYQTIGNEIFINMNLNKVNLGDQIKSNRKTSVEAKFKREIKNVVLMEIPKGYKIAYLPENSVFKNDLFGYNISYNVVGNEVILTSDIFTNFLLLEPSNLKEWNNMLTSLNNTYKKSVDLVRTDEAKM